MQTKCTNCGTISPLRTDICDKCGGMSFKPHDENDTRTIGEIVDAKATEEREVKAKEDAAVKEAADKVKAEATAAAEKAETNKETAKTKKPEAKKTDSKRKK